MGLNWKRARTPKATEDAMGEGFVRHNGTVTPILPKDSLAKRAAAAERTWLKEQRIKKKGRHLFKDLDKPVRK